MLKVMETYVPDRFPVHTTERSTYKFYEDSYFSSRCSIDGVQGILRCDILKGYECDGVSTFFPITLKLPHWKDEPKYDCAGLGHDILYGGKGKVTGLQRSLSQEEADDFIRGAWREAGIPRVLASTADFFLVFAHTKRHWGADQYNCNDKAFFTWFPFSEAKV